MRFYDISETQIGEKHSVIIKFDIDDLPYRKNSRTAYNFNASFKMLAVLYCEKFQSENYPDSPLTFLELSNLIISGNSKICMDKLGKLFHEFNNMAETIYNRDIKNQPLNGTFSFNDVLYKYFDIALLTQTLVKDDEIGRKRIKI